MINIKRIISFASVLLILVMTVSCQKEITVKTLVMDEFSIQLDSSFDRIKNDSAVAFFSNSSYSVICTKEEFSKLDNKGETTEQEYAAIIKNKYPEYNAEIKQSGNHYYLEYQNKAEYKNFYYNSYVYKTDSAFYTVHFATAAGDDNSLAEQQFALWAQTVSFE